MILVFIIIIIIIIILCFNISGSAENIFDEFISPDKKIDNSKKYKILPFDKFNFDIYDKKYIPYFLLKNKFFKKEEKYHTIQSITKSIVSFIVAIAIENSEFIDSNLDNNFYKDITPRDLLNMRSGIVWNMNYDYTDPRNTTYQMEHSNNWIEFIYKQNIGKKEFKYKDCDTVLFGEWFYKKTKYTMLEYGKKYLFDKYNIPYYWHNNDIEGGLYMPSKSLLKIAKLFTKYIKKSKYLQNAVNIEKPASKIEGGFENYYLTYSHCFWILYAHQKKYIVWWGWRGQFIFIDANNPKKIYLSYSWKDLNIIDFYKNYIYL